MYTSIFPYCEPEATESLLTSSHAKPVPAVLVGAQSASALTSTFAARDRGLIEPILIGKHEQTDTIARELGLDISCCRFENVEDGKACASLAATLLKEGDAQFAIKGDIASHTYLRAFITRTANLRTERMPSHCFHMYAPRMVKPIIITDGAFQVAPTPEQRLDVLANAIDMAKTLGISRPTVAALSASEVVLPSMPTTGEADWVVSQARQIHGDSIQILGPVALDIALSAKSAKVKGYEWPGSGEIDILLVPSIEVGNALFKMMVYALGACAAGVVCGLKAPLVLTSRADAPAARLSSIGLACKIVS